MIASFSFGPVAASGCDAWTRASGARSLLDAMAARLGPRAAKPVDVVETAWWTEDVEPRLLVRPPPPGRDHPPRACSSREPFGRVHWAGTETATVSHGAIDGAVRSGRAGRERESSVAEELGDQSGVLGAAVAVDLPVPEAEPVVEIHPPFLAGGRHPSCRSARRT